LKMIDLGMSSGFTLKADEIKGTYDYMAPEVFRGVYGPEADMWSLGVVLFVMLIGRPFFPDPYASPADMDKLVHDRSFVQARVTWASQQILGTGARMSPEAHSMLRELLVPDRYLRLTVKEALQHPFVTGSYHIELHDDKKVAQAVAVMKDMFDNFRKMGSQPMLSRASALLIAHVAGYNLSGGVADLPSMSSQRLAFRMLDFVGNGELSVSALIQMLPKYNIEIPADIDDLFKYVDSRLTVTAS